MSGPWTRIPSAAGSLSSRSIGIAAQFRPPGYATFTARCCTKAPPGILVTTAEFGPSAQEFATGKPLTLLSGTQLVDLLAQYGVGQYTVQ